MMNARKNSPWLPFCVLVGFTIMLFVLENTLSMSSGMHKLLLTIIVILTLVSGANLIYLRANAQSDGHDWWNDDDWTDWGGI